MAEATGVRKATVDLEFKVAGINAEKRYVYGWASIATTKSGETVTDLQGDQIDIYDLEDANADFVKHFRQGGEMHEGAAPNDLIAAIVFTPEIQKALGIPEGTVPGGWFVGFEVTPESMKKVKAGDLLMFSIEGECAREEVEA